MPLTPVPTRPRHQADDVVVIGGAASGSASAWFLSANPDFSGSLLVVERDASLEHSATMASNNCMRQLFATEINVKIAQYAAEFVKSFRENLGANLEIPHLPIATGSGCSACFSLRVPLPRWQRRGRSHIP
jgi:glycine/D-amino acid oxidase-like deaminating enzyme